MAPWSIVRYVVLTLWLQVQVQVWFSIPVIVLFRCLSLIPGFMSDPEFYVSSYYSGCSHEQTRDRLAGDARVADSEAGRRLPRIIYIHILPVSLVVATWALVVYLIYLAFALRQFESSNKLYFWISAAMMFSSDFQLMHCLSCFMSCMLLLYFVLCAVRHSTGSLYVHFLLPFSLLATRSVLTVHVYSAPLE